MVLPLSYRCGVNVQGYRATLKPPDLHLPCFKFLLKQRQDLTSPKWWGGDSKYIILLGPPKAPSRKDQPLPGGERAIFSYRHQKLWPTTWRRGSGIPGPTGRKKLCWVSRNLPMYCFAPWCKRPLRWEMRKTVRNENGREICSLIKKSLIGWKLQTRTRLRSRELGRPVAEV